MPVTHLKTKWSSGDLVFYGTGHIYLDIDQGAVTSEEHGYDIDYKGTVSSGDSMVGLNVACTPSGTAGTWASGIYSKVVMGTTKSVNGYLSGIETEIVIGATDSNLMDFGVLVLNWNNSATSSISNVSHGAYIMLREYSSVQKCQNLLCFYDVTPASNDHTALVSTTGGDIACDATIRILVGTTPYWIMLSSDHA